MPTLKPMLLASLAALALAGCDPDASQAPAPAESLVPLPTEQPAPPAPDPSAPATEPAPSPPETKATQPAAEPADDQCGAGKLDAYRNLLPTTDAMDKIRKAIGHERIRVINPGDAVTMDFRPDRLNIEIGEDGRIKVLRCG